MKKTTIRRHVTINASKDKVWEVLADFGNVQQLSPNIKKSYLTSEQENGVGAKRHCDFTSMGAQVEEQIVEWKEGESMKIDIYETKNMPMIRDMEAVFDVREAGNSTLLTGAFSYGMSNAFGSLMNSLAMKKMNIKSWKSFMSGIKHHLETEKMLIKKRNWIYQWLNNLNKRQK